MKYLYIYIGIALSTIFLGCKKFVQIEPPKTKLVSNLVFMGDATATSAMLNIYLQMMESGISYEIPMYTGLQVDELRNYSNYSGMEQSYMNDLRPEGEPSNKIWNSAYNLIYQANAIYEGCQDSKSLSPVVKKQLMAEATFVRAFWNFYLINLYGDVPLVTSTDYLVNASSVRMSKQKIYDQIINDLKYSQTNLSETYVAANSSSVSNERLRPNKYVACALLARVYLYTGAYSLSEQQASLVINNQALYDLLSLDDVFKRNSKEAIWQTAKFSPNYSGFVTPEGYGFILDSPPLTYDIYSSTSISNEVLKSFEAKDLRKISWLSSTVDGSVTPNIDYYFPFKYKIKYGDEPEEYSMVLRLAEQYLIRAEARVQQSNLPGGIEDLDKIRHRAGLALINDTNPSISKDGLLIAISNERKIELLTEWGDRFFDLKRTEQIDKVMTMHSPAKGGVWNTYKQVWPIPQKEIQNNPNLTQNLGYNR